MLDKVHSQEERIRHNEEDLQEKNKELSQKENVYQNKYKELLKSQ